MDVAQPHIRALDVGPVAHVIRSGHRGPRFPEGAVTQRAVRASVARVTIAGVVAADHTLAVAVLGVSLVGSLQGPHQPRL